MSALAETLPPGLEPPSSPQGRSGFLADVIVDLGLAERDAVDQASRDARLQGVTLAAVLVDKGVLGEPELARAVAERHGLAMVDLEAFPLDPEAGALVGRATSRRYGVVPVGFAPDGSLMLAMADPGDSLARSDVAVMTKLEVTPVIAPRTQIEAALEQLPETGLVRVAPAEQEPEPEAAAGAILWQSEEPDPDPAARPTGMVAVRASEEQERVVELEDQLRSARAELRTVRLELGELKRRLGERGAA